MEEVFKVVAAAGVACLDDDGRRSAAAWGETGRGGPMAGAAAGTAATARASCVGDRCESPSQQRAAEKSSRSCRTATADERRSGGEGGESEGNDDLSFRRASASMSTE